MHARVCLYIWLAVCMVCRVHVCACALNPSHAHKTCAFASTQLNFLAFNTASPRRNEQVVARILCDSNNIGLELQDTFGRALLQANVANSEGSTFTTLNKVRGVPTHLDASTGEGREAAACKTELSKTKLIAPE